MDELTKKCIEAYSDLKHLKLTGERVGIPWQTVYIKLKAAGIAVNGDKQRYGSISDKLAAKAEQLFAYLVPFANDNNETEFQSSIDFNIGSITIDVKASALKEYPNSRDAPKWGFCVNRQKDTADYFVMFAYDKGGERVVHTFLIPNEIANKRTTISIPASMNSKWADYEIMQKDLTPFFMDASHAEKEQTHETTI